MLRNIALSRPLAIFDLETTSKDTKLARIVEISILKLLPGGDSQLRTKRVNPGVPIPPDATALHGITDADVAGEPTFGRLAQGVIDFLEGCDLCGYNVWNYDLPVLVAELRRFGKELPLAGRNVVDTMKIYHKREPRDLASALKLYAGREHDGAHGAEADVLATIAVLDGQVERYPDLPRTIGELHSAFVDPDAVDLAGNFKQVDGQIVFTFGKYKGRALTEIANDPVRSEYLGWMLDQDFFEDTKAMVRAALAASKKVENRAPTG